MGFLDIFRPLKTYRETKWRELGSYVSIFAPFGSDMYRSDTVRSCIRAIAEHTSKANAVCTDKRIANILNMSPNMYMNGKDFLYKIRTRLELLNTAFIYIQRDDKANIVGFYPVPYITFEALEYSGRLFIKFQFSGAIQFLTFPWEDLAVLRKDYNKYDVAGDDNTPILQTLDLISTVKQGVGHAVKATANLRGILKNTKAMLSEKDVSAQKEKFVKDYLNLENEGGIASLDATQEFTPINMSPTVTSAETMKEFREDVYRYFGINDDIIMSHFTETQMEAFYEARIEPFLVALSIELTRKVFSERERAFDNQIIYESNRMNYASNKTKLEMIQLVDRGILTPNELRRMFNLPPYEGGDEFIRRLDTQPTGDTENDEGDENNEE